MAQRWSVCFGKIRHFFQDDDGTPNWYVIKTDLLNDNEVGEILLQS